MDYRVFPRPNHLFPTLNSVDLIKNTLLGHIHGLGNDQGEQSACTNEPVDFEK